MSDVNKIRKRWEPVEPSLTAQGSSAQCANIMSEMKGDILALCEEAERNARNRDMWKGQVERQSAKLERWRKALHDIANGATGYLDRDSDLAAMARAALESEL